MKKTLLVANLSNIAAVLAYVCALFAMFVGRNTGLGLVLMCCGSSMLCLGGVLTNRCQREQKEDV